MHRRTRNLFLFVLVLSGLSTITARADEVTDWTQIMLVANHTAGATAVIASRNGAIVESSIFDAVNGVKGHYSPIHVAPAAPKGTSARAAAVQAAYVSLMHIYPAQSATFNAARTDSLNAILATDGGDNLQAKIQSSVDKGVAWGQQVADAIWTWRSTDGFSPAPAPYLGDTNVGDWRPTPPAFASGANPQFAYMTPWVIASPSQFRPAGPPALGSVLYAQVFNETKIMGRATGSPRTADQTLLALFWQSSSATYFWNSVALRLTATQDMTLLDNAHLFGALNVAIADSVIAAWDAKYYFHSWRPVTAINLADTDGNIATDVDTSWTPLIPTPAHPEYPSAHSTFSGGGAAVLAALFGQNTPFTVDSDAMPGVTRSFTSFNQALAELADARIFGGIHFRTACEDGLALGSAVGNYILQNAFLPGNVNGNQDDDDN
jgi:PAP2 superfamily